MSCWLLPAVLEKNTRRLLLRAEMHIFAPATQNLVFRTSEVTHARLSIRWSAECTVTTHANGPLFTNYTALALFARRTRIPTNSRSIRFCAIWVCIKSTQACMTGIRRHRCTNRELKVFCTRRKVQIPLCNSGPKGPVSEGMPKFKF